MIQLEPAAFGRVASLPLWAGLEIHLAVASVLAGTTPGSVYVDDAKRPAGALVHTGGRLYLAGSPGSEAWRGRLNAFFLGPARPGGPASGLQTRSAFTLDYSTAWQADIEDVLTGTDHFSTERAYLERDTTRPLPRPSLPPGLAMRPVDHELLANDRLGRLEELRCEMVSECPSVEFFLRHRFGVCLVSEGTLAGWCLSEYDTAERSEVGIETAAEHRHRGLGTAMVHALATEAHARGVTRLGWHSYAGNDASLSTALRAGFLPVATCPVYVLRYARHDFGSET